MKEWIKTTFTTGTQNQNYSQQDKNTPLNPFSLLKRR